MSPSDSSSSETTWMTLTREYEGFPLYLRFPRRIANEDLQSRFPVLWALTHTFSFRRFDGSPEPAYNDTLGEFDHALVTLFERDGLGHIVLVETFAGKRHYYFYVQSTVEWESVLHALRVRFPGYTLAARGKEDPTWQFLRQYRSDFGF